MIPFSNHVFWTFMNILELKCITWQMVHLLAMYARNLISQYYSLPDTKTSIHAILFYKQQQNKNVQYNESFNHNVQISVCSSK